MSIKVIRNDKPAEAPKPLTFANTAGKLLQWNGKYYLIVRLVDNKFAVVHLTDTDAGSCHVLGQSYTGEQLIIRYFGVDSAIEVIDHFEIVVGGQK